MLAKIILNPLPENRNKFVFRLASTTDVLLPFDLGINKLPEQIWIRSRWSIYPFTIDICREITNSILQPSNNVIPERLLKKIGLLWAGHPSSSCACTFFFIVILFGWRWNIKSRAQPIRRASLVFVCDVYLAAWRVAGERAGAPSVFSVHLSPLFAPEQMRELVLVGAKKLLFGTRLWQMEDAPA
jgi:hypothetical protein